MLSRKTLFIFENWTRNASILETADYLVLGKTLIFFFSKFVSVIENEMSSKADSLNLVYPSF